VAWVYTRKHDYILGISYMLGSFSENIQDTVMLIAKIKMLRFAPRRYFILVCLLLSACTNDPNANPQGAIGSQWDFDHELQYKQTKLSDSTYQLEVISNQRVSFEHQSAFLLRRGYLICGQYGYKLVMITGVESFDFPRASPNLIMPNLKAKLECPKEK